MIRRWYAAPALVEAILELRCVPAMAEPWTESRTQGLAERFPGFSTAPERLAVDAPRSRWGQAPGSSEPRAGRAHRVCAHNEDRTRAVQYGPGICALNVFQPYGHFEDHVPTWRRLVEAYLRVADLPAIDAAEQRYVNHFVLGRRERPSTLFRVYPPLAENLAHPPLALELETSTFDGGTACVSLRRTGADDDRVDYRLEVVARADAPLAADVEAIVQWHHVAHMAVNEAFETSVTDECRTRMRQI
jgi:uncharacterized protein (TIGR04255 family)